MKQEILIYIHTTHGAKFFEKKPCGFFSIINMYLPCKINLPCRQKFNKPISTPF